MVTSGESNLLRADCLLRDTDKLIGSDSSGDESAKLEASEIMRA